MYPSLTNIFNSISLSPHSLTSPSTSTNEINQVSQDCFSHYKALNDIPRDPALKEELKQFSLLSTLESTLKAELTTLSAKSYIRDFAPILAHVLGDSFISRTFLEGHDMRLTADHMVKSLDKILSSSYFINEEKRLLALAKVKIEGLSKTAAKIREVKTPEDLRSLGETLAASVMNLKKGDSLLIPGGWIPKKNLPGHGLLYEFERNALRVYNTGAGIAFHDRLSLGTKSKLYPVLEYLNIPDKDLFFGDDLAPTGFLFQALVEPSVDDPNETRFKYNIHYIYDTLLEPFESYRVYHQQHTLTDFISEMRSGTCSWKVITAFLRYDLPVNLYKKVMLFIKAETLLEGWLQSQFFLKHASLEAAQTRELLKKCARQFNRRLEKVYAKLSPDSLALMPEEWLRAWVATTVDMLNQLKQFESHLANERKRNRIFFPLTTTDSLEYTRRLNKLQSLKNLGLIKPEKRAKDSYHFVAIPAINPKTISTGLVNFLEKINTLLKTAHDHDHFRSLLKGVRAQIELLAEQLPIPHADGENLFWDKIEDPKRFSKTLLEIGEVYTQAVLGEKAPTFDETVTFFTFYSIIHYLAITIEKQQIAELELQGKPTSPLLLKDFGIFNPLEPLHLDRFLICTNAKALERMETLTQYFEFWSDADSLFQFSELRIQEEDEEFACPDFRFYASLIQAYELGEAIDIELKQVVYKVEDSSSSSRKGKSQTLKAEECQVAKEIKRIAFLHQQMLNSKFLSFHGINYLIPVKRFAYYSHFYCGYRLNAENTIPILENQLRWKPKINITTDPKYAVLKFSYPLSGERNGPKRETLFSLKDANNHIGNTPYHIRFREEIPLPISEATVLKSYNNPNGQLYGDLERAAANPEMQPSQTLYAFRGKQSLLDQLFEQNHFLLFFFKLLVNPDVNRQKSLFSPAIEGLASRSSLRKQASEFILNGIDLFWHKSMYGFPNFEGCLFHIQLAQRIRQCLNRADTELFMADLETKTIEVWLAQHKLQSYQKVTLHFFRLYGYYSRSSKALQEDDLVAIFSSWVFLQNSLTDKGYAIILPEMRRQVESYVLRLLAEDNLQEPTLQRLCTKALELCDLFPPKGNAQWTLKEQHPIYQLKQRNQSWTLNLATGLISNEVGILRSAIDRSFESTPTFKRLFKAYTYQYTSANQIIYFQDPVLGQFRYQKTTAEQPSYILSIKVDVDHFAAGLQWQFEEDWYQYVIPETFEKTMPHAFLSASNLWLSPSGQILICSRTTNKTVGRMNFKGKILLLSGRELRLYPASTESETGYLTLFERPEYIEQQFLKEKPIQLEFPRYQSLNSQPLTFDAVEGRWVYRQDPHYHIANEQEQGLLPAVHNTLLLVDDTGKQRKLIVPCQQLRDAEDFSGIAEKGLDVEDWHITKEKESYFSGSKPELHDDQRALYHFLDYQLDEKGEPLADKVEAQLFLAYLYLHGRDYQRCLNAINRIESSDAFTGTFYKIYKWMSDLHHKNHDHHPNASALCLHLFLKLPLRSRKYDYSSIRDHYESYIKGISSVEKRYLLPFPSELIIANCFSNYEFIKARLPILQHQLNSGDPLSLTPQIIHAQPRLKPETIPSTMTQEGQKYLQAFLDNPFIYSSKITQDSFDWPSRFPKNDSVWKMLRTCVQGSESEKRALLYQIKLLEKTAHLSDFFYQFIRTLIQLTSERRLYNFVFYPRGDSDHRKKNLERLIHYYNEYIKTKNEQKQQEEVPLKTFPAVPLPPHQLLQLTRPHWSNSKGERDLSLLATTLSEELHLLRDEIFKDYLELEKDSPVPQIDFTLDYDPKHPLEEERAYAKAIAKEFKEFENDYRAGRDQILSQQSWKPKTRSGYHELTALEAHISKLSHLLAVAQGEVFGLARLKPQTSPEKQTAILHEYSGVEDPVEMRELVLLFLKGSRQLFEKANPHLKGVQAEGQDSIHLLYQLIGKCLIIETEIQTTRRVHALSKRIQESKDPLTIHYLRQQMGNELAASRHYSPSEHPEFLVFEYCSNLLIRQRQVELLQLMLSEEKGRYKNCVVQLIMGGGKTSVLASILCHLAAKPGRLSLFITPASQFETVKENLKITQRRCFNQGILPLDFRRDHLTIDFLQQMTMELENAIENHTLVLMKVESLQVLELEFISTARKLFKLDDTKRMSHSTLRERFSLLRDLLLVFRKKADALIDEVDQVLDSLHTVNFPDGEYHHVEVQEIDLISEIYSSLVSDKIFVSDNQTQMTMHDFVALQENKQTLLTLHDIDDKIAPALALHLAKQHPSLFVQKHTKCFVRYVTGKMNIKLEALIAVEGSEEESLLTEEERQDLAFLRYLRTLFTSSELKKKQAANLVALTKHVLRTLLPITFAKNGGRNYGRARNNPEGKVVPYLAVDTPAPTEFGYHYEALCYQFQTALQFGVKEEQIKTLAKNMTIAAKHHAIRERKKFEATPEAISFIKMTNVKLSEIDLPGNYKKAVDHIQSEAAAGRIEKLVQIEASTAVNAVTYYAERLESTAPAVLNQVDTARAFTGTLWNGEGFPQLFYENLHYDLGTEGQVAYLLMERFAKHEANIHTVTTDDPGAMLEGILVNHPQRQRVRGLMDAGGLFKKTDNRIVAKSLLNTLTKLLPDIKGILFFYRPEEKETADTLALLKPGLEEPLLIDGSSQEAIKKTGIKVEEYFVYYDDRHTSGVDILQIPSAINLLTVDETLLRRGLFQAVLRLRQFFFEQTVELVVHEASKRRLVGNGETMYGVIKTSIKNQAIHKSKDLYRSFKQLIDNVFRQEALQLLLKDDGDVPFAALEPFLVGFNHNTPYQSFGRLDTEVSSLEALKHYREKKLKEWKNQNLAESATILHQLDQFKKRAEESEVIQTFIIEPGSETIGVQQEINVQVQQQQQQQVQVQVEQELMQELQSLQNLDSFNPKRESAWEEFHWMNLVMGLQRDQETFEDLPTAIKPLNQLLDPTGNLLFSYRKPYHLAFDSLLATENYAFPMKSLVPLFHRSFRPAQQILLVQSKTKLHAVLLSSHEAIQLQRSYEKQEKTSQLKQVWLAYPDGQLMMDNPQMPLKMNAECQDILLAVNALNGEATYLDCHAKELLRWLQRPIQGMAEKEAHDLMTDYIKLKATSNPDQREILKGMSVLNAGQGEKPPSDVREYSGRHKYRQEALVEVEEVAGESQESELEEKSEPVEQPPLEKKPEESKETSPVIAPSASEEVTEEQLQQIYDFERIRLLPGHQLPKISVGAIYAIPLNSLLELDGEKIKYCTFFQKLVLSIHHLAMGLFSLVVSLVCLTVKLPAKVFGYSLDKEWRYLQFSIDHLKRSFTVWLAPIARGTT